MSTKRKSPYDASIARLKEEIARADKLAEECSGTPAVAATKMAAALRQQLESAEEDRATEQETDPLARVRRRLRRATADRSWTAVANLTEQERMIEREQREAAERAKQEEMRSRGSPDLEDQLVEMLMRINAASRARVLARLIPDDTATPMN